MQKWQQLLISVIATAPFDLKYSENSATFTLSSYGMYINKYIPVTKKHDYVFCCHYLP
jgi:hypothetical protein